MPSRLSESVLSCRSARGAPRAFPGPAGRRSVEGMTQYTELPPVPAGSLLPHADRLRRAAAAYLARCQGTSRVSGCRPGRCRSPRARRRGRPGPRSRKSRLILFPTRPRNGGTHCGPDAAGPPSGTPPLPSAPPSSRLPVARGSDVGCPCCHRHPVAKGVRSGRRRGRGADGKLHGPQSRCERIEPPQVLAQRDSIPVPGRCERVIGRCREPGQPGRQEPVRPWNRDRRRCPRPLPHARLPWPRRGSH